ncbi:hypothetical protein FKR81_31825 [Lentzea tibetensis]|uniref:Transcriptional regulator n=1 Tax=Lentzea tibetensis TaxID=2591470 RepID=A0A563EKI5_9PSEU|nr:hypothetical protein [Lentzea tibetensis]TWP47551.1 hypothetical protein FKR81_31825 [Lentzea tibetensis]
MDYRLGGDACLDAVRTRLRTGQLMLEASASESVRQQLHVALADLHNLAGWVCFDAGQPGPARAHFTQALELARLGHHDGLVANICYRLGRMGLHHEELGEADDHFQLGLLAATLPGNEIAASILTVNSAWTHAKRGDAALAHAEIERGKDLFAAADRTHVPDWARFFTDTDLSAAIGAIHTDLARTADPRHAKTAIPLLVDATDHYDNDMARSRAFSLILLSIDHLIEQDLDHGVDVGFRALASAECLASARVRDRIRPLGRYAERHRSHAGARELTARIAAYVAAPDSGEAWG